MFYKILGEELNMTYYKLHVKDINWSYWKLKKRKARHYYVETIFVIFLYRVRIDVRGQSADWKQNSG